MKKNSIPILIMLSVILSCGIVQGQTLNSGTQEIHLIELFTSEGCSSCPPADRWLSEFKRHEDLWKTFVPLAFHVDYWDYIGWKDGFAKPEFSQRQRKYSEQGNINSVYTPSFVIQGREWRGWFERYPRPENSANQVGNLQIELRDNLAKINFKPKNPMPEAIFHFALLGFDIERAIHRGENAGVLLNHDFVVLAYWHKKANQENKQLAAQFPLNNLAMNKPQKTALAAWVSSPHEQKPIQAVGGWYQATP